jgi:hypothetical protein
MFDDASTILGAHLGKFSSVMKRSSLLKTDRPMKLELDTVRAYAVFGFKFLIMHILGFGSAENELMSFGSYKSSIAQAKFWFFESDKLVLRSAVPLTPTLSVLIQISYNRMIPFGLCGRRTPITT